jgi:hypothetical protein
LRSRLLLDDQTRPDLIEQCVFGDGFASGGSQHFKHVKCASAKPNRDAVMGQAPIEPVEPEWSDHHVGSGGG